MLGKCTNCEDLRVNIEGDSPEMHLDPTVVPCPSLKQVSITQIGNGTINTSRLIGYLKYLWRALPNLKRLEVKTKQSLGNLAQYAAANWPHLERITVEKTHAADPPRLTALLPLLNQPNLSGSITVGTSEGFRSPANMPKFELGFWLPYSFAQSDVVVQVGGIGHHGVERRQFREGVRDALGAGRMFLSASYPRNGQAPAPRFVSVLVEKHLVQKIMERVMVYMLPPVSSYASATQVVDLTEKEE